MFSFQYWKADAWKRNNGLFKDRKTNLYQCCLIEHNGKCIYKINLFKQIYKNIILVYYSCKIYIKYFILLISNLSNSAYICIYSTCRFEPITFQGVSNHMWVVPAILDNTIWSINIDMSWNAININNNNCFFPYLIIQKLC